MTKYRCRSPTKKYSVREVLLLDSLCLKFQGEAM